MKGAEVCKYIADDLNGEVYLMVRKKSTQRAAPIKLRESKWCRWES